MLHHVLSKLQPGFNELCKKTGILCCASAFGIDRNIFFSACTCQVCVCVLQRIPITILVKQYLLHCKILPCYFRGPPREIKNNNKKQDTNNLLPKGVPNVFSSLCTPRRHTLAKQTQLYGHAPPPCSTTEAPHCTHGPRMQPVLAQGFSEFPGSLALQTSTRKKLKTGRRGNIYMKVIVQANHH